MNMPLRSYQDLGALLKACDEASYFEDDGELVILTNYSLNDWTFRPTTFGSFKDCFKDYVSDYN